MSLITILLSLFVSWFIVLFYTAKVENYIEDMVDVMRKECDDIQ